MEENHGGRNFLKGVRHDIKTLLTNFEKTGSLRFADFCKEWKQMGFSLIFRERRTVAELLEFSEEVIHIAKGYLESPWKFHIQIGALYLLYGLYFKQPLKGAANIRLTKEEWVNLNSLINQCKEEKHYDAAFIHLKLYIHGAYTFTIIPRATGLEKGFRKYDEKCKEKKNNFKDMAFERKSAVDPGLLDSLIQLEKLYSDQKEEVLGKKNLDFVDKNFGETLKSKMDEFYSQLKSTDQTTDFDNFSVPQPEPGKSSDVGRKGPDDAFLVPESIEAKLKKRVMENTGGTAKEVVPQEIATKSKKKRHTTKKLECDEEEEHDEEVDSSSDCFNLPQL